MELLQVLGQVDF